MKIGFTGTRLGMNQIQANIFRIFLLKCKVDEFHHGGCVGADIDAHHMVNSLKIPIIIHPPIEGKFRADLSRPGVVISLTPTILSQKGYLERNKDIVDQTDMLIAVPAGFNELVRSGTWMTIRYARKCLKNIYIIFMDGTIKEE